MDLALNSLQRLMCLKTQTTNQPISLWAKKMLLDPSKQTFHTDMNNLNQKFISKKF